MIEVERFVNSRFTSNTYVLSQPEYDNVWIVDPGDTEKIFEWMKIHSKTNIVGILLTHAHFDHIYGMNEILSYYPECIVYIANEYGKEALHNAKANGSKYTEEGPVTISDMAHIEFLPPKMDLWRGIELQSIYTPGHSDDSVCFVVDGMLFTGDTLIKNVRTVTKLKTGSVEKLRDSIKLLSELKGNGLKVMPGHDESFMLDEYDMTCSLLGKKQMVI